MRQLLGLQCAKAHRNIIVIRLQIWLDYSRQKIEHLLQIAIATHAVNKIVKLCQDYRIRRVIWLKSMSGIFEHALSPSPSLSRHNRPTLQRRAK